MTGDNRLKCERCNSYEDCEKFYRISQLPDVLTVQIKRFRTDSYFGSKIGTQIKFPVHNLDMRPFCTGNYPLDESTVYDLFAVVAHHGGHNGMSS